MKFTHLLFTADGDVLGTRDVAIVRSAAGDGETVVVSLDSLTATIDDQATLIEAADPKNWADEDFDGEDASDDE